MSMLSTLMAGSKVNKLIEMHARTQVVTNSTFCRMKGMP